MIKLIKVNNDSAYNKCPICVNRNESCQFGTPECHFEEEGHLKGSKWIPISERLPESSGYYLVSGGKKIWICELLNIMGVKGWSNDAKNPIVEAWQPLPEPYEEESEEE